jgi:hypothetical protein
VRRLGLGGAGRSNHNKAACALANKLARICYATLRDKEPFAEGTVPLAKKINRQSFRDAGLTPASRTSVTRKTFQLHPSTLATRLIDHHGQPGSPHTVGRR